MKKKYITEGETVITCEARKKALAFLFNPSRVGLILRTFRNFRTDEQRLRYVNRNAQRVLVAGIVFG